MNCLNCQATIHSPPICLGVNADQPSSRVPIHRCPECGLAQSNLTAITQSFDELYFEGYYGETQGQKFGLLVSLFQAERRGLALSGKSSGQILDVGCGDGVFLKSLPSSWKRYGFEPSKPGQASLQKAQIPFLDITSPPKEMQGQFDVVTMWHSLEHIEHPEQPLRALHQLLKPGGILFVSVPNIKSLQARLFASRWFHLDPTRHIVHYDLQTLSKVLHRHGWQIQSIGTLSFEYNVFGWWQSFFNLLPFDFNMAYKKLKRKKDYSKDPKNKLAWLCYLLLSPIILPLAGLMTLVEASMGMGGVLNVKAIPAVAAKSKFHSSPQGVNAPASI